MARFAEFLKKSSFSNTTHLEEKARDLSVRAESKSLFSELRIPYFNPDVNSHRRIGRISKQNADL